VRNASNYGKNECQFVSLVGTIDGAASKSSVTNANLFLDLAAELIAERLPGAADRRAKRASSRVKSARAESHIAELAPPSVAATAVAAPVHVPAAVASSQGGSVSLSTLFESPVVLGGIGIFLLLTVVLFAMIISMFSRVSSLEAHLGGFSLDENALSKVAFLEYVVSQIHKNLTGSVRSSFDMEYRSHY